MHIPAVGAVRTIVPLLICCVLLSNHVSGSYLGCFRWSKLYKFAVKTSGKSTLSSCLKICSGCKTAFYGLTHQQRCICGSLIPDTAALLPDAACTKAQADTAYVNYIYDKDPSNKMRCKLEKFNLAANTVDIPWGKERITFNKGVMTMPLKNGYDGGRVLPKLSSYLYGMFSIQIKVSGEPRPVTAVYLASETVFPYQTKWCELDIEFLNSAKGKDIGPGTLWTNLFYGGQEVAPGWLKQEKLQTLTRNTKFSACSDFHTYSINWQSKVVDWHVDGAWVDRRTMSTNVSIPDKPMWLIISLWSMSDKCEWFGGCGPTDKDYVSYFQDLRRVTCQTGGAIPVPPGGAAAAKDISTRATSFMAPSTSMQQCGMTSIGDDCLGSTCCPRGQTCMAVNDTFWGCMGQLTGAGVSTNEEGQDAIPTLTQLPAEPSQCGDGSTAFVDVTCASGWECLAWNETFSGCVATSGRLQDEAGALLFGVPCGEFALPDMDTYDCASGLACERVSPWLAICLPDPAADRDGRLNNGWAEGEERDPVNGMPDTFDRDDRRDNMEGQGRPVRDAVDRYEREQGVDRRWDGVSERFERAAGAHNDARGGRVYDRRQFDHWEVDRSFDRGVDPRVDGSFDRGVDPRVDRSFDRGVDPRVDRSFDRGVDPRVDRSFDRGVDPRVDRSFDRGVDPRVDRSFDRGVDPRVDRGVDPRVDRSFDRGVDPRVDHDPRQFDTSSTRSDRPGTQGWDRP